MIYSMTGYGKGIEDNGRLYVEVEVKTVNSRYLDIFLKLPTVLMNKEYELREYIKTRIKRGKLTVVAVIKRNGSDAEIPSIDLEKLNNYLNIINEVKKAAKITEETKLEHLLSNKDIFSAGSQEFSEEDFNLIKSAFDAAIKELIVMKRNEGEELALDLKKRIKIIGEKLEIIESESTLGVAEYFGKLKEKVELLIGGTQINQERMEQEIALIAEKSDITEECVRLKSHMKFFMDSIEKEDDPGRKLNFLCQEMNREANTISSKSLSVTVTHNSVLIKDEIEKIREQIQNIE